MTSKWCRLLPFVAACFSVAIISCVWDTTSHSEPYLPLDDSEYPYANVPRLVIETEDFKQIRNTNEYVPALLQIYGKNSPESAPLPVQLKGRGTSSFNSMPKYSLTLKLGKEEELLDMPKDKDWALISNSADKTLLKNFITLKLYSWLGGNYAPQTRFVELYLNRQYLGVYLLSETVKAGSNRVNIPKNGDSFLFEKTSKIGIKENDAIVTTDNKHIFCIKSPKYPDTTKLLRHLNQWESLLQDHDSSIEDSLDFWLDLDDYLRFYWVQEFTKNSDANFNRSIFITWVYGQPMHYGPVWDFDLAYGNWIFDWVRSPKEWYVRYYGWDKELFQRKKIQAKAMAYWKSNKQAFYQLTDSIAKYAKEMAPVAKNEFKRWPVLKNTENWTYKEAYSSYEESIDSLNSWIRQRYSWIESQYK